jgi:hypothetical protein
MSELRGRSHLSELVCDGDSVHISANFRATSPIDRAVEILRAGGLLSVKAHIIKNAMGHIALDAWMPSTATTWTLCSRC